MRKLKIYSELIYLFGVILLSLSIAMLPAAGFGLSMLAAPAFLLSEFFSFLTFGQADYIVEGLLLLLFFLLMRKVRLLSFSAFITSLLFGAMLDFWRAFVPILNPTVTAPGSMELWVRIALFAGAVVIGAFAIALMFRTYLYPQIYELFVKGISEKFGLSCSRFKMVFDGAFLLLSVVISLVLFHGIRGIGFGTIILVICNGPLIGWFEKLQGRVLDIRPLFPSLSRKFALK